MSNRFRLITALILGGLIVLRLATSRHATPPVPVPSADTVANRRATTPPPARGPEVSIAHLVPRKSLRPFEKKDFGRLPALPAGYRGADTFEALVAPSGHRLAGKLKNATEISVGNGSCPLSSGTNVYLLARRGDLYIADVSPPCQTSTHRIREGYIPTRDVDVSGR